MTTVHASERCYWCGGSMCEGDKWTRPTVEHIVPRTWLERPIGAQLEKLGLIEQRLETACQLCNSMRGHGGARQWVPFSEFFLTPPKDIPYIQQLALFRRGRLSMPPRKYRR